jgi:Protein of unknown function (DUF4038)/Domain of unknown function (DUF5060)
MIKAISSILFGWGLVSQAVQASAAESSIDRLVDPTETAVPSTSNMLAPATSERIVEWTIVSRKTYKDPFNDVDLDVVFSKGDQYWRVPAFWRGGSQWTVRFAPPDAGDYTYKLESTDKHNPDLNGPTGHVTITAYTGSNALIRHGLLRVSANKRFFEYADGTPFYWLGDTLWTGLSDRLPWDGFQRLVADRQQKGFTVVQICAGLMPSYPGFTTSDPGYSNEGGPAWDAKFSQINPRYFDFADRRIQRLIDAGIAPAIVGAWSVHLNRMGASKIKKHWRYLIARYGAYPVLWIVGGEVLDPPQAVVDRFPKDWVNQITPGWTDMARFVRATDPYHHLLTMHETAPPYDFPVQDESVTDFTLAQPGHFGWSSIGAEVMQLNTRYSRTDLIKPLIVGEIGYELIGGTHLEDFQRVAFWLAMLNGAAGSTYGASPTYEVNNPDKPLLRNGVFTFLTWEEGMNLPGSYQVGINARLLQRFPWWQMAPHPEWVAPRATTLLTAHIGRQFDPEGFKGMINEDYTPTESFIREPENAFPAGEWKANHGTFRGAYAAGIPGKLRVVYTPIFGIVAPLPPTVLDLEMGVQYHAYYWEPILGIKIDLGNVALPAPGAIAFQDKMADSTSSGWVEQRIGAGNTLGSDRSTASIVKNLNLQNAVAAVDAHSNSSAGILLRYRDADNYIAAIYSAREKSLYLTTRTHGENSPNLGIVSVTDAEDKLRLTAEVRLNCFAASITDGHRTWSTPIVDLPTGSTDPVDISKIPSGAVGVLHQTDGNAQRFNNFEVRQSPKIARDDSLNRRLIDAHGVYRGQLSGPGWDDYGTTKAILLDGYRPEHAPTDEDWVLVLDALSQERADTSKLPSFLSPAH